MPREPRGGSSAEKSSSRADDDRREFYRPVKEQITLRLDKDVLAWFKAGGEGYQTRINEALREYVVSRLSRGSS
jgi:uncharacterized protein (DUF4415 family)